MKFTEEDLRRIALLAYGSMPDDGVLLSGSEIQLFARKAIEALLRGPAFASEETE